MIPVFELRRQYRMIRDEIDLAVRGVLKAGHYVLGPNVEAFEAEFSAYCGGTFGVGVANGTEAIQLALTAAGIKAGDEVITVSHTAVPTVEAIKATGAVPVLVDIDPQTWTIDPAQVRARLGPRTAAIVPVHLYGHPADLDPLRALAERHGLALIEDAAQAHGARYKGRHVGAFGTAGCFSFYPTKNLGAYGDGGMVVTNDRQIADRVRRLRNHGQAARFEHVECGMNSRLDELQAAVLRVKLRWLDRWNQRRRQIAALYNRLLADLPVRCPPQAPWAQSNYHLYVIEVDERDALRAYLKAEGIGTDIHYPKPVHLQPAYCDLSPAEGQLPVTESLCQRIVSLPLFPELSDAEAETVASAIRTFLENRK